jgi:hypothetical protein
MHIYMYTYIYICIHIYICRTKEGLKRKGGDISPYLTRKNSGDNEKKRRLSHGHQSNDGIYTYKYIYKCIYINVYTYIS